MGERTNLKVPRRRVLVELGLAGHPSRRVELFLGEHRNHAWHRQEVLDLLEGDRQFLPYVDAGTGAGGRATLVNRDHIEWVALASSDDRPDGGDGDDLDVLYDERHAVTLRLGAGPPVEGTLLYSAPSEHARLMDYLNQPGAFLSVHAGDRVILVRKSAVVEIVESDPGDEPERKGYP